MYVKVNVEIFQAVLVPFFIIMNKETNEKYVFLNDCADLRYDLLWIFIFLQVF